MRIRVVYHAHHGKKVLKTKVRITDPIGAVKRKVQRKLHVRERLRKFQHLIFDEAYWALDDAMALADYELITDGSTLRLG